LTLTGLVLGLQSSIAEGWERSPTGRAAIIDLLERSGFTPRERW
jgi:hypothetical protein